MIPVKPFNPSYDRTAKYTIKEVAAITGLSAHTIRYYDNENLIPGVDRTDGNARLFSDYNISWLHLVNCLRTTGLPVEQVRHYIRLCQKGDSTIQTEKGAPPANQRSSAADGSSEIQREVLQGKN